MAEELELLIEGRTYSGWESATFFRTIEACTGSFSVEVANLPLWPIEPGQRVQALLDGQPFATGYIDAVKRSFDKSGRKMSIEGRDLTADLVDCSAQLDAGEVWNVDLEDVALLVASPLGVEVLLAPDADEGELFDVVAVNSGEGAWECLERCLRMRGLLAFAQPTGALLITRPSALRATSVLAEGSNLKAADMTRDHSARFRSYTVTSQRRGDDQDFGDAVGFPAGTAEDLGARASRTLILEAEQNSDDETCDQRARWEATTRAARSMPVNATVAGWRRPGPTSTRGLNGPLWTVNERVRFVSPSLRIDEELLVASCRYRLSKDQGRTTEMGLMRPDAFLPQPSVPVTDFGDLLDEDATE